MRKLLLFTLSGLFYLTATGQEFERLSKQALNYFSQGEYPEFEEIYPRLYNEYLKINLPPYQQACQAVKDKDTEQAILYLEEIIEEDLFIDEIVYDANFEYLHSQAQWSRLIDEIQSKKEKYKETVRLELKEIQNKDQGIRLLYLHTENDSLKSAIHAYMKKVDEECAGKICSILDKYGWLGPGEVGYEGNETLFLAIQHVDDLKVQEKYLPMLQDAVTKGHAEGWHLAFLTDRILMNQGKKQIYGTQKIIATDPSKSYIIPLEYPDKVDELREEVGLPSLQEEWEEEGLHWDVEEYNKNLPEIEKMYKERFESLQKDWSKP